MQISKNVNFIAIVAAVLAVALQIHTTIFHSETYPGLRVSSADLLLPALAFFIPASLLLGRSKWPEWKKPFGWWAPILMTLVITGSMINSYYSLGELNQWALVNKFSGWFVLMAYLGAGAWISTNYHNDFIPVFLRFLFMFFIVVVFGEVTIQIGKSYGVEISPRTYWQSFEGFMNNRNIFAFLFINVATLITFYKLKSPSLAFYIFWILAPILVFFNSSRTLWICIPPLLILCLFYNWKKSFRVILPCVLVGSLLFFTIFTQTQTRFFTSLPVRATSNLYQVIKKPANEKVQKEAVKIGNKQRIEILKQAIVMFEENPVFGSGLGSAIYFQEKNLGKKIDIIDNTSLWLLAETGFTGLMAFMASYIAMAVALWRNIGNFRNPRNIFALWALLMLGWFGLFSLAHEILYTRFFWFILGLALAIPKARQDQPAT